MSEVTKTKDGKKDAEFLITALKRGTPLFKNMAFVEGMDLSGQSMKYVSFTNCEMPGANIEGADICFTIFSKMDLRTFRGLDRAKNLGLAAFKSVLATDDQKRIITDAKAAAKEDIGRNPFAALRKEKKEKKTT